uniref:Uncharacterized protein n=1 Tax=Picea glauca TaxID=3330 RepID=A0A101LXL0_PICGL|nr:hypothetical protein ABT39_MTgene6190 [Picea glauca]QHR88711.1 hypothetical protein Q903MT_gene2725 [Picea sitchensis]
MPNPHMIQREVTRETEDKCAGITMLKYRIFTKQQPGRIYSRAAMHYIVLYGMLMFHSASLSVSKRLDHWAF